MPTVTVLLSDEMAKIVNDRVEAGDFLSTSHMIEDALALLDDRVRERERRLAVVREKLDVALRNPIRISAADAVAQVKAHMDKSGP